MYQSHLYVYFAMGQCGPQVLLASSRALVGYYQVNTTVHGVGRGTMIMGKFRDSPCAH